MERFRFNLRTLSYQRIEVTGKQKLLRFLVFAGATLLVSAGFLALRDSHLRSPRHERRDRDRGRFRGDPRVGEAFAFRRSRNRAQAAAGRAGVAAGLRQRHRQGARAVLLAGPRRELSAGSAADPRAYRAASARAAPPPPHALPRSGDLHRPGPEPPGEPGLAARTAAGDAQRHSYCQAPPRSGTRAYYPSPCARSCR